MHNSTKKNKKIDIAITIVLTILGFFLTYISQGTFLGTAVVSWGLYIVLPVTLYLSLRQQKPFRSIIVGTLILGAVFGLILETLAEFNGAWHVTSTLFSYRFPGGASLDAILGYLLMTFLTFVIYEHFLDKPHKDSTHFSPKRLTTALAPSSILVVTIFILVKVDPQIILFPYTYAIAGVAAIVPALIIGFKKPFMYTRMVKIMPYFFFVYLVFEYFAVTFGWWVYPSGQYIGRVALFGVNFPIEELLFWMLFYAASLVAYYETWIDDGK